MNSKNTLSELVWSDEVFETAIIDLNALASSLDLKNLKLCFILYDDIYIIFDGDLSDLEFGNFLRKFNSEEYVTLISRENSDFKSPEAVVDGDRYHRNFSRVRDEISSEANFSQIDVNNQTIPSSEFIPCLAEVLALSMQEGGVLVYSEEVEQYVDDFLISYREDYGEDLRIDVLDDLEGIDIREKSAGYVKNLRTDAFNLVRVLNEIESPSELLDRRERVLYKRSLLEILSKVIALSIVSALVALESVLAGAVLFILGIILRNQLTTILNKVVIELYALVNPLVKVFKE